MMHDHRNHGEHAGEERARSHSHGIEGITGVRLLFVMLLNFLITAAEVVGGIISGSLSLISDALHNLSDATAVIISYYALKISGRKGDAKKTFGYRRASIMAALLNSSVLVGISGFLFKEAYDKFMNPGEIDGMLVIWIALISLAADFVSMLLLRQGSHGDINVRSAYIHLLSDTLSSLGVVVAGVLILLFRIYWVDPLLTVLISVYILVESVGILKKATNILMQGTPEHIRVEDVAAAISGMEGVLGVHHVHIWSLDESNIQFEAHVDVADMPVSHAGELSARIEAALGERFGINHVTLQFECGRCCNGGIIEESCAGSSRDD